VSEWAKRDGHDGPDRGPKQPSAMSQTIASLPTAQDIDRIPAAALDTFLVECAALLAHAAARLGRQQADRGAVTALPVAAAEPERRVRAPEAAKIIECSVRWLRQHGHTLPSYRRDMNGRRVTWLPSELRAWKDKSGSC